LDRIRAKLAKFRRTEATVLQEGNWIAMEELGQSICSVMRNRVNGCFSMKTTAMLGVELVRISF
jgi:hypothetical protein